MPAHPRNKLDVAAPGAPVHAFSALRMVRKLRLNQLLIVDSVLQTFSFAITAQNLGMTQSAVTKAVQHLESFFETRLFERTNRGVRPTELGLRMGEHARIMLAEMRYMTDSLNALRLGEVGHVVIGTLTTASSQLLPDAIRLLRARHPNISLSVVVGDRDQLHRQLLEGKVDLAMGSVPVALAPGAEQVRYHVLYEDDLYVVAGQHHPLANRDELHLSELLSYPWIIPPPESIARPKIERLFADSGLALPSDVIESLSPITNIGLLMDQRSLSLMSGGLAQLFLKARLLVRLDVAERCSFGDVGYAVNANRAASVATEAFIRCLKEQVGKPAAAAGEA
jgi:DNA-binding transcriptional LysR family regulator